MQSGTLLKLTEIWKSFLMRTTDDGKSNDRKISPNYLYFILDRSK